MSLLTRGRTDPLHAESRLARWAAVPERAAGQGLPRALASDGPKSGPITVHTDQAAPWDPGIYNQSIPDSGYSYLTTRDGTKLAIDVHPPTSPAGEPGLPAGTPPPERP